jgi:hypothetical protein
MASVKTERVAVNVIQNVENGHDLFYIPQPRM